MTIIQQPMVVIFPVTHFHKNTIEQVSTLDCNKYKHQYKHKHQNSTTLNLKSNQYHENKPQFIKNKIKSPIFSDINTSTNRSSTSTSTTHAHTCTSDNITKKINLMPKIISRINPIYPSWAKALGLEGLVKIMFDINAEGRIENIRILSSQPKNTFEKNIRLAMRTWKYEPGKITKNLTINFKFYLKNFNNTE
ncbi:TonB family protein [Candidatus Curculioniphilus buchneri]|uniref:TonB family protein n=1 Tax=Candidatus Curculioniphilus buchneri TaxID=690594 RepID=UPI00376F1F6B